MADSALLAELEAGRLAGCTRLDLQADLEEVPRSVFNLADTLEILNLSSNCLRELPDDLPRLHRLRTIFCSDNQFTSLPAVLGRCPQLQMIGFKANQIAEVPATALPPRLRWLILTDNQVSELPSALGSCTALRKLMLAGNRLRRLPTALAQCRELELMRLAANELSELPEWLFALPRLAWLAYAGNSQLTPPPALDGLRRIPWNELTVGERIGEGASGIIYRAMWRGTAVALKLFKGALTSDGSPADEMIATLLAGDHPHLISAHGQLVDHPHQTAGLVLRLLPASCRTLALPPSLETCTRDCYRDEQYWTLRQVGEIAQKVSAAAEHLHARGIMHGDLYAHNVAWNAQGDCVLGDFGAASQFSLADASRAQACARLEVLAFGHLFGELLARVKPSAQPTVAYASMRMLQERCVTADLTQRPTFSELVHELSTLIARM